MIIKVKKPGDCLLRHPLDGLYKCRISVLSCGNNEVFPAQCPLRARTVIIQKEQTETIPNQKEKPVTADVEKDADIGEVGKEHCCQIDCEKDAEWEIYADGVADTAACTEHVGELLTDASEHRIFRLKVNRRRLNRKRTLNCKEVTRHNDQKPDC